MGVTIMGVNHSIDMPYLGFTRLQTDIAYMISQEFGRAYARYVRGVSVQEANQLQDDLERMAEQFVKGHGKASVKVLNFLFCPDTEGKVTPGGCKEIRKVIEGKTSALETFRNTVYGYPAWSHPVTGDDFLNLLSECEKDKHTMRWEF
jgi:hypothetical protein